MENFSSSGGLIGFFRTEGGPNFLWQSAPPPSWGMYRQTDKTNTNNLNHTYMTKNSIKKSTFWNIKNLYKNFKKYICILFNFRYFCSILPLLFLGSTKYLRSMQLVYYELLSQGKLWSISLKILKAYKNYYFYHYFSKIRKKCTLRPKKVWKSTEKSSWSKKSTKKTHVLFKSTSYEHWVGLFGQPSSPHMGWSVMWWTKNGCWNRPSQLFQAKY